MNTNGFDNGPIRRYKKQKQTGGLRLAAILAMTAVLVVAVSVIIMSLAGVGLFADRKEPVGSETSPVGGSEPDSTETPPETTDPTGTTPPQTTEPPVQVDPNAVQYTYADKSFSAVGEGLLTLINAQHLYQFPSMAIGNLDDVFEYGNASDYHYVVNNINDRLDYRALEALNAMAEAFTAETGSTNKLLLSEAYRDFDTQNAYWNNGQNKGASVPGASDYHSGATLYLDSWDAENQKVVSLTGAAAQWLRANAHKYGFVFRSPAAKKSIVGYSLEWQLRYVGLPHAQYMYENDLCLEEYLQKLSTDYIYNGDHLTVAGVDGKMYEIFYVEASEEGITRLPVPSNRQYTVSGNNIGGFIVTVTVGDITVAE